MPEYPEVVLVRHGETEWSLTGQHTGSSDIPLTENGIAEAEKLQRKLSEVDPARLITSPLQRASETCRLTFPGEQPEIWDCVKEWIYGDYEGLTTDQIQDKNPGWDVFQDGCPGGESVHEIEERADETLRRLRSFKTGNTFLFSHGHFSRVLIARWLGLPASQGALFKLSTAAIVRLSYDHNQQEPVVLF